ncbi:aconitate hydratase [Candidatus Tisiphia endosymbiont of Hybos culiciformis]|uniref:aconitate hydratase n=1 Tax=Candidatus Tisiphia endosymbiont of Hybos culiciformis TaxID=3139331 RepID=UPI003CCB4842
MNYDYLKEISVGDNIYKIFDINKAANDIGLELKRLPYSLRILFENVLRLTSSQEKLLLFKEWLKARKSEAEIPFMPARVLMQDFTGVPAIVDLAAMRDAIKKLGGDPLKINPLIPVDLVIDHSVQVDYYGTSDAFDKNVTMEVARNIERYQFLKWGQEVFDNFKVVPPGTGICHQVNLEHLANVVWTKQQEGVTFAYPDTLVGTDSHTTMVNGLSVLGWGVGGIEAEAAMLGQPLSMILPEVIGFKLSGSLNGMITATDLVLTVTQMLRKRNVVGKFVEFYGDGLDSLTLADRATISNMAPEYGATCGFFPIDNETIKYLNLTARDANRIKLVEQYAKLQSLWYESTIIPEYTDTLELDLSTIEASLAGPRRPQDRVNLKNMASNFNAELASLTKGDVNIDKKYPVADIANPVSISPTLSHSRESLCHSREGGNLDPCFRRDDIGLGRDDIGLGRDDIGLGRDDIGLGRDDIGLGRDDIGLGRDDIGLGRDDIELGRDDIELGEDDNSLLQVNSCKYAIGHGDVVIAAITSCTNTSNPNVMIGAGLLAKKAVELGLVKKPWVKTSLAPGSKVVTEYLKTSGLDQYLNDLGFNLVGYGCTTCIGNSGSLLPEIEETITKNNLVVASVLSGNRNFEGRVHPLTIASYLASPPLVIAYAITGTININLDTDPIGKGHDGKDVYLKDIWPTQQEIKKLIEESINCKMFKDKYSDIFLGDKEWQNIKITKGDTYNWNKNSTYINNPPYFEGIEHISSGLHDIGSARILAIFGNSITTDHISPAGNISKTSPAAKYLTEQGISPADFNSYGSRRGNHQVMMRGTFANNRIKNAMCPGIDGGITINQLDGQQMSIYDAAQDYKARSIPLVIFAGKEYGSGSSRDWAAKGTSLLGVKAVIAESFERIHRSNLVGMGVLPLVLTSCTVSDLKLDGSEYITITDLSKKVQPYQQLSCTIKRKSGIVETIEVILQVFTDNELDYIKYGSIMHLVVKNFSRLI